MNVERQAYHGKSFIGNHVHTCCKVAQILPLEQEFVESQNSIEFFFWQEDNIIKLCSAVVTKTEELCPSFLSQAREISVKFDQVYKLSAACHLVYDSADYCISMTARLISQVSERKNLTFMENMNTVIRSCLKSVPPFLVFLLQRKTSQIFFSSLGKNCQT